jgi:DnaK suppressor protein
MATKTKMTKEPVMKVAKVTAPESAVTEMSKITEKSIPQAVTQPKADPVIDSKPEKSTSKVKPKPPIITTEPLQEIVSEEITKSANKVQPKVEPVAEAIVPSAPPAVNQNLKWQEIRLILEKLKDDTVREIRKSVKNGTEAVAAIEPGGDIYDQASSERDRELGLLLGDREREKIHSIDEALLRISEGDYGICEECDEDIPLGRLKAMPFTRHCVKCKSDLEKLQAQTKRVEEERAYREIPLGAEDEES